MIHFIILINRQGKLRLSKWYEPYSQKQRAQFVRDISHTVLPRTSKMCNVVELDEHKLVYKRYASLFFVASVSRDDNELLAIEMLHMYVEALDQYFGSVCELDLIFNMDIAHYVLDEVIVAGQLLEPNRRLVKEAVRAADILADPTKAPGGTRDVGSSAGSNPIR
ncbi:AP-1 complex subunit sigma-2 [Porphyridium purpureum]|uniref:AP complex subunit sigma n=1 Tax=Porphyridium purpureum TaxID=35688 RepID=A0A5J4Z8F6_PORPP|nr:AP-1 complex subunit sigma-2 [Porphyridium purpureum]|eukprot:POR6284..scf295_1